MRADLVAIRSTILNYWAGYLRGDLPQDWKWINPPAAMQVEELKRSNRELREQLQDLQDLNKSLMALANSLRVAEERAEKAEAREKEFLRRLAEKEATEVDPQQAVMAL